MKSVSKGFGFFWVKIVKNNFCLEINPQMNDEYRSRKFGICLKANTQTTVCLRLTRPDKQQQQTI